VFAALGLAADPALTDDEVRMAWRRVAAATHPDRADGGEPAAFAAAAAAYAVLRTGSGRSEVLADAGEDPGPAQPAPHPRARAGTPRWAVSQAVDLTWRISQGRPWRLVTRVAAALALCAAVLAVTGDRPAGPALVTGVLTWLALTARRDLAPRPAQPHRPGQTGSRRRGLWFRVSR
jgi:curved DNA-binding protein CbpA